MTGPRHYLPDVDGNLTQSCVCGRKFADVPAENVRAGIGWSCGPNCGPGAATYQPRKRKP